MKQKKVLYIQAIHEAGMNQLREKYDVVVANNEEKAFLLNAVRDASAIVTRLTAIDADIINAGPKLEAIAKNGVGVDNINVALATEKQIAVLTTGHANTWSVAEHTMFAVGALYKQIARLNQAMHNGDWKSRDAGGIYDVEGRTFGIIGLGRIGQEVALLAKAFHMDVLVYDPYIPCGKAEALGYTYAQTKDELFRKADVVSLHMPLTEENTHLINDETLAMMKPAAFVINFARGPMVDEDALYRALSEKRIAGAALDAFTPEPPHFEHPLYKLDNVLLSPHTAGISEDARRRMSLKVAEGIDDVLSGRIPECAANRKELYGI